MADRTLTVNGQPFTFNRDRFAGVRTMTVTVDELPLTDATTSIKVTVAGHSDLDGIYTGSASADSTWSQQGGNGQIVTSSYNSDSDSQTWFVNDSNDGDPTQGNVATTWHSTGASDRPWKANLPSSHPVTITGIAGIETVTVDRTASVIDSDRKGESRPLLSNVVGGAAVAYSLRDLNDKAGNNKVVRVRRASDNEERDFLAKEVSNATLEAWVGAGNDGFVETWYDQSGNSNDATQSTAGSQPKIVNAGSLVKDSNGHTEIDFDGAEFLLKTAFTQGDLSQANTIFSVAKLDSNDAQNRKIYDGTVGNKRNMLFLSPAGGQFGFFADDVITTGVTANNNKNLFSTSFNGASSKLFINGTSGASGDVGDYPLSGIVIGKNNVGSQNFWLGQIQEIVIYNSDQTANRPAIEANINNQYDIY